VPESDNIPGDQDHFLITRDFDAPRGLVWKAWTESDRLAQWWGPKNFIVRVLKLDLRPGGIFHYSMKTPDGREMWGRFTYREIVAPERLVFTSSFADANADTAPNPWLPEWPGKVLNFVSFGVDGGKTALTFRAMPLDATEPQRKAFVSMRSSMQQAFAGTFNQLAEHLSKAS
jgi:uncharacterized protein YndB with AHSA1/START domain